MAPPASDRKPGENTATWALAVAQLVAWGTVYYAFSLFVVLMELELGWSRLSVGLPPLSPDPVRMFWC